MWLTDSEELAKVLTVRNGSKTFRRLLAEMAKPCLSKV